MVCGASVSLSETEAVAWVSGQRHCTMDSQISREIDYVLDYYQTLHPTVFLSYEREAYYAKDHPDFRITFDDTILCRQEDLSLESEVYGTPLLPEGMVLMEIKCSGGMPLWMTQVLSENHIYKTSFSKYGTAYETIIYPKIKEASSHDLSIFQRTFRQQYDCRHQHTGFSALYRLFSADRSDSGIYIHVPFPVHQKLYSDTGTPSGRCLRSHHDG